MMVNNGVSDNGNCISDDTNEVSALRTNQFRLSVVVSIENVTDNEASVYDVYPASQHACANGEHVISRRVGLFYYKHALKMHI